MTTVGDAYIEVRDRVIALLETVGDDEAEQRVPCCPEWTVRQLASHMAGVPVDALAGRLEGVATDPWTARHVDERAQRTLTEILVELRSTTEALDSGLRALDGDVDPRLAVDAWTHEQDLRQALGRPGGRDGAAFDLVTDACERLLGEALHDAGVPGIDFVDEQGAPRTIGPAPASVALRCSRFELARARLGRRSREQLRALGWSNDPDPWLDVLVMFGPAATEIIE